jgi:AbiV family abortive infection protein
MGSVTSIDMPTEPVRLALARAACDNAERLLRDAQVIMTRGSVPTAHSLGVLALEEVGKAVMCHRLGGADEQSTTRKKFLEEMRSHEAKLQRVHNLLDLLEALAKMMADPNASMGGAEDYQKELKEQAKADHVRKLQGFYVGLDDFDGLNLPEKVTQEEAERICLLAHWALKITRDLLIDGSGFQFSLDADGSINPSRPN